MENNIRDAASFARWLNTNGWNEPTVEGWVKREKTMLGEKTHAKTDEMLYHDYSVSKLTMVLATIVEENYRHAKRYFESWNPDEDQNLRVDAMMYLTSKIPHYLDARKRNGDTFSTYGYFGQIAKSFFFNRGWKETKKKNKEDDEKGQQ